MIQKKRILSLLALGLIIFSSFFLYNQFWAKSLTKNIEFTENDSSKLKSAKYWPNLDKIRIDDTIPEIDWATTAANNDWCNGSGTWNDPYIIKNVVIDGQESESCILIENSDVYFRIENCTVYNTGDEGIYSQEPGIKLSNTNNGTLISNNCSLNNYGIRLINSDNNTFSSNIINKNKYNGITLDDSSNNTFTGNEISFTGNENIPDNVNGIFLLSMCTHNNISQNDLHNNFGNGIYLLDGNNNTIYDNDISKNNDYGILIGFGLENTITKNTMKKCGIGISPFEQISTNIIDTLNTVNGRTVYFYFNQTGLDISDFLTDGPAGQIMLVKCNDSIISHFNLSQTSVGLYLSQCKNITISNNLANNCTKSGFLLTFCNNNTIYNNSVNYNMYGMDLTGCNNITINRNNATNNELDGIILIHSHFTIIHGNNASNNIETGIYTQDCENNNITENFVCTNKIAGIKISESHFTLIKNNTANNNIHTLSVNYGIGI